MHYCFLQRETTFLHAVSVRYLSDAEKLITKEFYSFCVELLTCKLSYSHMHFSVILGQEQQVELHTGEAKRLPHCVFALALELHDPVSPQGLCPWTYW